jgi:hypothetical protein
MKTIKRSVAESKGYRALTNAYRLPDEQWMLDRITADLERGKCNAVIVEVEGGFEVWRKNFTPLKNEKI